MPTSIFVNLHVKDLKRSVAFFTNLGYTFNPQFTDDNATCLIIDDRIFIMLLVEPFFKSFTNSEVCDTSKANEAMIAFDCESRQAVDDIVAKAIAAGASDSYPKKDHGFMYESGFADLDGHIWSYFYMDKDAIPQNP